MSVDINFLTRTYFYFDLPVPYKVKNGTVEIKPVMLKDNELLASASTILNIDKNAFPDASVIQMSYLEFICRILLDRPETREYTAVCLRTILSLCLGLNSPELKWEAKRKIIIHDKETGLDISAKQFDDIKKIIMFQNFLHYDDDYLSPEMKKAMEEVDELKNKDKETPSMERRMAIITAHSGLPKREQELMTYRSHCALFEEVVGEVEFTTIRPAYLFSHSKKELEHWIFKKSKDKLDGYITSIDSYTDSMGGAKAFKSTDTKLGDSYVNQYNNFNK